MKFRPIIPQHIVDVKKGVYSVHPYTVRTVFIRTLCGLRTSVHCADCVHTYTVRIAYIRTLCVLRSSVYCVYCVHPYTVCAASVSNLFFLSELRAP